MQYLFKNIIISLHLPRHLNRSDMNNIALQPNFNANNIINIYKKRYSNIINKNNSDNINSNSYKLNYLFNEQILKEILSDIISVDIINIECSKLKIKDNKYISFQMLVADEKILVKINIKNDDLIKIVIYGHMFLFEPTNLKDYSLEYDMNSGKVNQEITYNSDQIYQKI